MNSPAITEALNRLMPDDKDGRIDSEYLSSKIVLTLHYSEQDSIRREFSTPARLGALMDWVSSQIKRQESQTLWQERSIGVHYFKPAENLFMRANKDGAKDNIILTDKETALIQCLAQNPDGFSKEELYQALWQYHPDVETHTAETHIYRLRQKIEPDPSRPQILITKDGKYQLEF